MKCSCGAVASISYDSKLWCPSCALVLLVRYGPDDEPTAVGPAICFALIEAGFATLPTGSRLVGYAGDWPTWDVPGLGRTMDVPPVVEVGS